MEFTEDTMEIAKALNTFRLKVKQPVKNANNPFFKSKYVQLEGVTAAIDDALGGTGLSYVQEATSDDNQVAVTTVILHESGERILLAPLAVPVTKSDAQAFGSAETYARRYALSAAFGITSDVDDDGNAAAKAAPKNAPRRAAAKPAQPKRPVADGQTVVAIKQMIMQLYKAMPEGPKKPASVEEMASTYVGWANGHFGGQASNVETLEPASAAKLKTKLETAIQQTAGGENE